jgi:hypothetical protein
MQHNLKPTPDTKPIAGPRAAESEQRVQKAKIAHLTSSSFGPHNVRPPDESRGAGLAWPFTLCRLGGHRAILPKTGQLGRRRKAATTSRAGRRWTDCRCLHAALRAAADCDYSNIPTVAVQC